MLNYRERCNYSERVSAVIMFVFYVLLGAARLALSRCSPGGMLVEDEGGSGVGVVVGGVFRGGGGGVGGEGGRGGLKIVPSDTARMASCVAGSIFDMSWFAGVGCVGLVGSVDVLEKDRRVASLERAGRTGAWV